MEMVRKKGKGNLFLQKKMDLISLLIDLYFYYYYLQLHYYLSSTMVEQLLTENYLVSG